MLVLTRGEGESIAIGPDIVITVCRIRENRVRIGLTVPDNVRVLRSEIVGDDRDRNCQVPSLWLRNGRTRSSFGLGMYGSRHAPFDSGGEISSHPGKALDAS